MAIIKLLLLLVLRCKSEKLLDVAFTPPSKNHDFEILINGESWFKQNISSNLSNVCVRKDHLDFSTKNQSLKAAAEVEDSGEDNLGLYESFSVEWVPSDLGFKTEVRVYQNQPFIAFSQHFKVIKTT